MQKTSFVPSERAVAVLFVIAGVLLRLVPHPWNFAPITGLALFSGAFLRTRVSVAVLFAALLASDMILGFHKTMFFTWGSFLAVMWIGRSLSESPAWLSILGRAAASSILFFVVTNFGVFVTESLYPFSWQGLQECYWRALPFFRNSFLSDLVYTAALFGAYHLATLPARKIQTASVSSVRAADPLRGR